MLLFLHTIATAHVIVFCVCRPKSIYEDEQKVDNTVNMNDENIFETSQDELKTTKISDRLSYHDIMISNYW